MKNTMRAKKLFLVFATVAALAAGCFLGACGAKIADNTEHYDKITKTLKLSKSYEGKKLMTAGGGGIGKATLVGDTTDGDTTNFKLEEGGTIAVRYEGVDTPESTAGWEKWGKAASNFTNECLHEATEIVLESSTGDVPDRDTSGNRPMCYVWYKTAKDDFKLLNLELVENGFPFNKESATSGYYGYFQKAEKFARSIELRLFSKLDDPLFNTAAIDLSLKEINENPANFRENAKVRLYAYVSDMYTASNGAITFTIAQYDETNKRPYSLTLYAGHVASTANMRVGDLYHIVGTLQKHDGNWQITGVTLSDSDSKGDEEKTWRSQVSYYLYFDSSNSLYAQELTSNFHGDVTVTSATLEGTKLTFIGTAPKIDGETPSYTFTVEVPADYAEGTIQEGTTLSVSGCYQFEARSNQLTIPSYSNIKIK